MIFFCNLPSVCFFAFQKGVYQGSNPACNLKKKSSPSLITWEVYKCKYQNIQNSLLGVLHNKFHIIRSLNKSSAKFGSGAQHVIKDSGLFHLSHLSSLVYEWCVPSWQQESYSIFNHNSVQRNMGGERIISMCFWFAQFFFFLSKRKSFPTAS